MDIEYVDSPPDINEPLIIDYNQMPISCEPKQPIREDLLFYQKFINRKQPISKVQSTIKPTKPIRKNKKRKAAQMELFATHDEYLEHQ
jgi:hypothetical protein